MNTPDEETIRKPPRIQRRRLGRVRFFNEESKYGFIESEDFREDVFFHYTTWQGVAGSIPSEDLFVEFELDDEHLAAENRLRAKVVRPTDRPDGRRLEHGDAPHLNAKHHPKARRRRPTWRGDN